MIRRKAASRLSSRMLDEATTWFVEFNEGRIDTGAAVDFIQWLRTSPEHVRAYLQVCAHWEDAGVLRKSRRHSIEELIALARADENVVPFESSVASGVCASQPHRRTPPRNFRFAIAASLLVAVVGVVTWLQFQRGTYVTDIGEQRSIMLTDGSSIDLNSRSKIRVSFSESRRDVELLRGQALFRVAKDRARPFVVRSGDARVRAIGTQFDVYKKRSGTVVTVVEGSVAVQGVLLTAGEQLKITHTVMEKPAPANVAAATAWTQKRIVFRRTPLADVVEEFNRYNTRQMIIVDPGIETVRIDGVFSSTDPGSLLRGLNGLGVFTVRETDDKIEIAQK